MNFRKNLRQMREGMDWTPGQLADRADVSRPMIIAIEEGTRQPTIKLAEKIAHAFRLTLQDMLKDSRANTDAAHETFLLTMFRRANPDAKDAILRIAELVTHQGSSKPE